MVTVRKADNNDIEKIKKWHDAEEVKNFTSRCYPEKFDGSNLADCICYIINEEDAEVGTIWFDEGDRKLKLGILLDKDYLGKKIGSKAIKMAIQEAEFDYEFDSIELDVRINNIRGIKCYQKCGFRIIEEDEKINSAGEKVSFYRMVYNNKLPICEGVYKVTDKIFYMKKDDETDRPLIGIINGTDGTLIVDAGNSYKHVELIKNNIAKLKISEPKYCAVTHWHWDHVFGIHYLNLPTIASELTKEKLEYMSKLDWSDKALDERVNTGEEIAFCADNIKKELPDRSDLVIGIPEITVKDEKTVELGDITCKIEVIGGDHSDDSTIIFVPEEKTIFIGDSIYPDLYAPNMTYTLENVSMLFNKLLSYDADYYFVSHHEDNPLRKKDIEKEYNTLNTIGKIVEKYPTDINSIVDDIFSQLGDDNIQENVETAKMFIAGLK